MSESAQRAAGDDPGAGLPPPSRPADGRELTPRAIIAGLIVAVVMAAAYPYIVLKLGFGPNVSVVAAIMGYLMLGLIFRDFNRWENNIVQTAGTSAAQTAFMCVLLAAFDMLKTSTTVKFSFAPTPFQAFLWLACASILGLLLAVPLRRHFIVDEKLTYADGVAAAETIIVLDSRGSEARDAALALSLGAIASGLLWFLQQDLRALGIPLHEWIPEVVGATVAGLAYAKMGAGLSISLLGIGSGMIVGTRINVSMAVGSVLSWIVIPPLLVQYGRVPVVNAAVGPLKNDVLRWVMWPATGMLIVGGLTALFLRWSVLKRTFTNLRADAIHGGEMPLKWVGAGIFMSTIALAVIQQVYFGVAAWLTFISVIAALPLMLVGLRVLGETNWGPISQISNMMQALFAGLAPGNLVANMSTSGTTGTIATQSEAIMQDYKAGEMIGSTPRYLTYMQIMAAPIGAAVVAYIYPVLRDTYGIGGKGLSSPISVRWAGFAEFLAGGLSALPSESLLAFAIGGIIGIALTLSEQKTRWLPSPTGLGIGMLVPGAVVMTMVLGGFLGTLWEKLDRKRSLRLSTPLASGMIAGEAIVAVVLAILLFLIERMKR